MAVRARDQDPRKAPGKMSGSDRDWSKVHGFNYQPSYGSNGFELWQKFDAKIIQVELARGKQYFPRMNALRWWQSWDVYLRNPKRYLENFETTLQLAGKIGCTVMPVFFNRWRDVKLDYGGIYVDHFFPSMDAWKEGLQNYLEAIIGAHKADGRILAWDLCNEPSLKFEGLQKPVSEAELRWLEFVHGICRSAGAKAPLTVGIPPWVTPDVVNSISDVLSIHPYWAPIVKQYDPQGKLALMYETSEYEKRLDEDVAFARKVGKPLIATECCWGHLEDKPRVDGIRYTLTQLKRRGIGWTVYLLHHSLIADAHRPEFGAVSPAVGNLAFVEADGSLRPGHEVFNEF